jgi:hypothetical protein
MKYLKKFNESNLGDELGVFCQEYLAYLTDLKFECYVNGNDFNTHITILDRDKNSSTGGRRFYWNEIEDDFIPFLQILSERYIITHNSIYLQGFISTTTPYQHYKVFSIKDVINGKIPDYVTCKSVGLQINGKILNTKLF